MTADIQKVRAFVAAAETGGFTSAAEALGVSQPSVSRMIGDLEEEWGVRLFERGRGGISLTPEGEELLPWARDLRTAAVRLDGAVSEVRGSGRGRLCIGTFSSVATHWLPPVMARFTRDHPGVSYELLEGDYSELERWVREGRVEFAFTSLPSADDMDQTFLEDDELMAVLPEGHPLASKDRVPRGDLCGEPFMLLEKGGRAEIWNAFAEEGLRPDVRYTTWDDYSIMSMVESGMGVSVLPSLILRRIPYRVVTRPLEPPAYRRIGVISRRGGRLSTNARTFLGYMGIGTEEKRG